MSIELRVFRRLVRLMFPEEFRGGYEAEMARTYRAQRREAAEHGPLSVLRLWIRDAGRPGADRAPAAPGVPATGPPRRRPADGGAARLRVRGGPGARHRHRLDNGRLQPRRCRAPASRAVRRAGPARRNPGTDTPGRGAVGAVLHGGPGLRRDARSFEQVAAYMRNGVLLGGPDPRSTEAILVSPNLLQTLRVRPVAGRSFDPDEDVPNGPAVVLIGDALARERLGSAKQAIGRSIPVDGRASTVVGVLPSELRFPDRDVELWLPMGPLANEPWLRDRSGPCRTRGRATASGRRPSPPPRRS